MEPAAPDTVDARLGVIGTLTDPVRRSLYRYVASHGGDVSRDEAAAGVGIQRQLAAFHLDKLVDAGLLEASFRRLSGRTGPGAGRPAKLYRQSGAEHAVSFPPRQYDLAAELLASAVDEAGDRPARTALTDVARRFGRRLGEGVLARLGGRASGEGRLAALAESLERYGYEPRDEDGGLRLSNCPFHALAESHRELVCGMNLSLVEGVVEGMGATDLDPCQDQRPGECCVTVRPAPPGPDGGWLPVPKVEIAREDGRHLRAGAGPGDARRPGLAGQRLTPEGRNPEPG